MDYQPLIAARNEIRVLRIPRRPKPDDAGLFEGSRTTGWRLENVSLDDFTQESRTCMDSHQMKRFLIKNY